MTVQGRQQAYSAGNKVYGFGRSNPTSGPVDPLGYRERNLMQAAIGRRLANPAAPAGERGFNTFDPNSQAALRSGGTITGGDGRQFQMLNGHATDINSALGKQLLAQRQQNLHPSPTGTMVPQAVDTRGGGLSELQNQGSAPLAGMGAQLTTGQGMNEAHPSGYIDPAGPPGMQAGGIPMAQGPGLTWKGMIGGTPQQSNSQMPQQGPPPQANAAPEAYKQGIMPDYAQRQHDIESGAYQQERAIQDAAPAAYQHLTDTYAGRGMVHSGRYADDYGQAQNATAGQIAGLEQGKTQQLAALDAANADWNQQNALAQQQQWQQQLQNQIGQAGSLGLDTTTQDPTAPDLSAILQQIGQDPSQQATPEYNYSPMQLQLMNQQGIAPGSMTPEQVHNLGVSMGFRGAGVPNGSTSVPVAVPHANYTYSPAQKLLMARQGIKPGTMSPTQVHALGVRTHFNPTPVSTRKPTPTTRTPTTSTRRR